MKRLFSCIRKSRDEINRDQLEKEKLVLQNMSWSLNETRKALSKSLFNNIPNETLLHIFGFLSVPDLCNVSLVCRSFKMISDQEEIWKSKCGASIKLYSKSYKQIYIEWTRQKSIRDKKLLEFQRRHQGTATYVVCRVHSYPVRSRIKYGFESFGGFNQHPNLTQEMTINLSVDIDKTAPELISLLEKASRFQEQWQQPSVLKQMIQRYYRFMQLKASNSSDILLIPTLDIEIVWQTHLVRPEMYRNDCLRLFRCIIDHSLIMKNNREQLFHEQAFLDTCQLYEQRFGEKYCSLPSIEEKNKTLSNFLYDVYRLNVLNPNESFYTYWDKTHFQFSSNSSKDYENPFSFTEADIILDGKWLGLCKEFMSNAIDKLPNRNRYFYNISDIDFGWGTLKRLKKSYERFLYMAAKYPLKDGNGFIPPTYAMDIIWHSHMQEPLNYESDCVRLVGYIIFHDPWPMIEDENMKKSCDEMNQIWKDEFQCEINTDHLYVTLNNRYT